MVRQNPAADGDRPHFYSQYWINVALGKPNGTEEAAPTAAAPAATATMPALEPEPELELPPPPARIEPVKPPKRAPEKKQEPARLSSLADLANIEELMKSSAAMTDDVVPDFAAETAVPEQPPIVTDFDLTEAAEEPVAAVEEDEAIEPYQDFGDFEFDEEEEEEDEWGGRRPGKGGGKKPPKPQRPPRRREF